MMNPDLIYTLHQQRHQKLWAEAERERAARDCTGARVPSASAGLATWLRRFSTHHMRGAVLTDRAS
jgi:hypothetical protein